MTTRACVLWMVAAILIAGCDARGPATDGNASGGAGGRAVSESGTTPYPGAPPGVELVTGQSIFVPAYSEVFVRGGGKVTLTTSLAIHNTDLSGVLVVESVRHYDTDGALVKEYVDGPFQLAPLATKVFFVDPPDSGAGLGANFIVEWAAEQAIFEPVVEAVMVGSAGNKGISLLSPGRVFEQKQ